MPSCHLQMQLEFLGTSLHRNYLYVSTLRYRYYPRQSYICSPPRFYFVYKALKISTAMTTSDAPAYKMTHEDDKVHSLIKQGESEFNTAARYLREHGLSTEVAQMASSILSKPFLTTFHALHSKIQSDALPLVNDMVVGFVKTVATECTVTGFWRVVRPNVGNMLEYTIALKDNILEHRAPFREFRLDYEEKGLNEVVALTFHLIPEELSSDVIMSEKIELA